MGNNTHHKLIQSSNRENVTKPSREYAIMYKCSDFSPERCHHLVIGEILVIIMVDGVTTWLGIGSTSVLVPIKPKFKVLCK